ncbi:hypothetical protein J6590_051570 [Homalodisca vitripennis]|nr:hypothetical protein J6590_051570 [Homalodisca vitripennis]
MENMMEHKVDAVREVAAMINIELTQGLAWPVTRARRAARTTHVEIIPHRL